MKSVIKKLIYFILPLLLIVLNIFYDKKYLRGKCFENNINGYIIAFRSIWVKNILRLAAPMPFPTALTCFVSNGKNIYFHPDDINNFQSPGTYYQNFKAKIFLGKGSYIGPNVGIITANHVVGSLDEHEDGKDVIIGEGCWVGMNSVILPGVELGANTVVAAGAVVTKSFPQGNVVLAGVPAGVLKKYGQ